MLAWKSFGATDEVGWTFASCAASDHPKLLRIQPSTLGIRSASGTVWQKRVDHSHAERGVSATERVASHISSHELCGYARPPPRMRANLTIVHAAPCCQAAPVPLSGPTPHVQLFGGCCRVEVFRQAQHWDGSFRERISGADVNVSPVAPSVDRLY